MLRSDAVCDVLVSLAIICTIFWPDLFGHAQAFIPQAQLLLEAYGRSGQIQGMLAAGLLICAVPRLCDQSSWPVLLAACVCGVGATVFYGVSAHAGVLFACAVVSGFVDMLLCGWLIRHLGTSLMFERVILLSVFAFAVEGALFPVFDLLPSGTASIVVAGLQPLAAGAALLLLVRFQHFRVDQQAHEMPHMPQFRNSSVAVAVIGAMSCVAYSMMRGTSKFGFWGLLTPLSDVPIAAVAVLVVCFFLIAYASYTCRGGSGLHRFMLPLSFLLLLYFMLATNALVGFGLSTEQGSFVLEHFTERYGHLFWWLIGCSVVGYFWQQAGRVSGAYIVLMSGTLMGIVALTKRPDALWLLIAMYAVLGFSFLMGRRVHEADQINAIKSAAGTSLDAQGGVGLSGALFAIAARYALSKREAEVLELLVQGWSRDRIADRLGLASGTIGSHCAHIYEKTRVSGKQELLGLVYSEVNAVEERAIGM